MKITSMNMVPIIAVSTVMIAVLAAAKVRSRKRRRSKSGEVVRSSHQIQTASKATPPTHSPTTAPEAQPQSLPWMIASVRLKRPALTRATPGQSRGARVRGVCRPRMSVSARTTPRAPTGRLNQKTAGQPQYQTSTPPSTGPAAAASELRAPKRPAAKPWRRSGNACRSRASAVGTTAAAPTPCTTRQATRACTLVARAQGNEAAVNSVRPSVKTSLWP